MAGKKGMKGSGGARYGAGRPGLVPDPAWKTRLENALYEAAAKRGTTPENILAERCLGDGPEAVKYWKLYLDYTKGKDAKTGDPATVQRAIILPAMNPDPADSKH